MLLADESITGSFLGLNNQSLTANALIHPPFKATLTDFRKAFLKKVHFCPRLAETKQKKIILDNMNSRICLGSSRYWLHKSDLITTKTAYDAISWNQWSALRTQNPLMNLPGSNPCEKEHKTPYDKRKSQNLVQFGWYMGSKSAFFTLLFWNCIFHNWIDPS